MRQLVSPSSQQQRTIASGSLPEPAAADEDSDEDKEDIIGRVRECAEAALGRRIKKFFPPVSVDGEPVLKSELMQKIFRKLLSMSLMLAVVDKDPVHNALAAMFSLLKASSDRAKHYYQGRLQHWKPGGALPWEKLVGTALTFSVPPAPGSAAGAAAEVVSVPVSISILFSVVKRISNGELAAFGKSGGKRRTMLSEITQIKTQALQAIYASSINAVTGKLGASSTLAQRAIASCLRTWDCDTGVFDKGQTFYTAMAAAVAQHRITPNVSSEKAVNAALLDLNKKLWMGLVVPYYAVALDINPGLSEEEVKALYVGSVDALLKGPVHITSLRKNLEVPFRVDLSASELSLVEYTSLVPAMLEALLFFNTMKAVFGLKSSKVGDKLVRPNTGEKGVLSELLRCNHLPFFDNLSTAPLVAQGWKLARSDSLEDYQEWEKSWDCVLPIPAEVKVTLHVLCRLVNRRRELERKYLEQSPLLAALPVAGKRRRSVPAAVSGSESASAASGEEEDEEGSLNGGHAGGESQEEEEAQPDSPADSGSGSDSESDSKSSGSG